MDLHQVKVAKLKLSVLKHLHILSLAVLSACSPSSICSSPVEHSHATKPVDARISIDTSRDTTPAVNAELPIEDTNTCDDFDEPEWKTGCKHRVAVDLEKAHHCAIKLFGKHANLEMDDNTLYANHGYWRAWKEHPSEKRNGLVYMGLVNLRCEQILPAKYGYISVLNPTTLSVSDHCRVVCPDEDCEHYDLDCTVRYEISIAQAKTATPSKSAPPPSVKSSTSSQEPDW